MQVHGSQQVVPGNLQKCKFLGPGPDLLRGWDQPLVLLQAPQVTCAEV